MAKMSDGGACFGCDTHSNVFGGVPNPENGKKVDRHMGDNERHAPIPRKGGMHAQRNPDHGPHLHKGKLAHG